MRNEVKVNFPLDAEKKYLTNDKEMTRTRSELFITVGSWVFFHFPYFL